MKITLNEGEFGWDYIIEAEDGRSVLIQTDYDYPGVASTFGWGGDEQAPGAIQAAQSYLDDHCGETVEDPGYFD